ncbi:hypothetical protein GCM10011529_19690 [Polymorphobacter glacialis]|uniref:Beta-monoglucosyldiacylglycerol synthase n=1 Tax=Sandarakinorhabdus glacialis TaxID=1614636 RepID=A0A916ZU49_9SPHN|nr:glycosyltransferase [Polymorphobacter glacialis]GGE13383.1 hypothetical protein GCM10011529_19690 [Polymorphobacter glacialis]
MTGSQVAALILTADAIGWLMLALLTANAVIAAIAIALRFLPAAPAGAMPAPTARAEPASEFGPTPMVSVHLPVHDEPAAMVIATLDALARLDYPAFEVIVIDNNTPDRESWLPVERHCAALGPRFRFVHRDGVTGAKAGALNIAAAMMHPAARYIAVVDADYNVLPGFLARAVAAAHHHRADYVQFPQRYWFAPAAAPVADELGDYFTAVARPASDRGGILLTGTLSLVAAEWLHRIGGWPTAHLTEDAELGLRLRGAGARGVFVDETAGHGQLPRDLTGLIMQRDRWAAGNIQALIGTVPRWGRGHVGAGAAIAIAAQLLAWPAFIAIPLAALTFGLAANITDGASPIWSRVIAFAASSVLAEIAALFVQQAQLRRLGRDPRAAIVKFAMLIPASLAWLPAVWGQRLRFRRTPKHETASAAVPASLLACGLWAATMAFLYTAQGAPLPALALVAVALTLPAALATGRMLHRPAPRLRAAAQLPV